MVFEYSSLLLLLFATISIDRRPKKKNTLSQAKCKIYHHHHLCIYGTYSFRPLCSASAFYRFCRLVCSFVVGSGFFLRWTVFVKNRERKQWSYTTQIYMHILCCDIINCELRFDACIINVGKFTNSRVVGIDPPNSHHIDTSRAHCSAILPTHAMHFHIRIAHTPLAYLFIGHHIHAYRVL